MKKQMLKNNRLVWFIALFIICVLSIVPAFMLKSSAAETTEGRTVTAADVDNQLYVLKHYEKLPRTIEATVNVGSQVSAASPIIGNLDTTSGCRLGLEINTSGNPVMYYYTYDNYTSVKKSSIKFSYDVRNKGEIRIAAINEIADGKSVYKLYANGELVSTVTSDPFVHNFDVAAMQREIRNLSLGCDYKNYFCGTIKNIAVYSDALTADEAYSSYKNGVDTAHADIIAYYDFTSDANTDRFIKDQTGNGHDAGDIFVPNENPVTDYAYSVAVIGDTQNLVYKDVTENTEYTTYIYDWIVANKESKNIQFVMGLGDITNYNLDDEWVLAQELLGKLEGANIPYSLIQGNHDTVAKLDQYFSTSDNFTKGTTVYYSGNSLGNYYMTSTAKNKEGAVTNNKYMIFSLEYSAKDGVIAWANDVILDNPEYSVIITTHAYLERDMSYLDVYGAPPPRRPYHTTGANNGDQIWMKLASQHENVIMVLAGHMTSNGIYKKEEIGVNGNTVFEFLIDPQGFDLSYDYKTGMVAMFYFSADGKKVATEYVSTYRSLEAQKIDKSAPDVLYNTYVSNFEFTIPENKTLSDVECEYGVIPARYSSATTYPFVVFNSDKMFVGGYFDFGDAMNAMVANDASADYNVLMRRNAEQCYASSIGALTGRINVDLGGFKLTKSQPGYLFEITVADNSSVSTEIDERASFKLSNGTVNKLAGEALVCIDYGSSSKGISKIVSATIDFEDIVFVASDADAVKWIFDTKESGYAATADGIKVLVNSTFTDCIFDYANSVDTRAALTLSCDTFDKVVYNIKINGGSIVSDTAIKLSEFAILNDDTNGRADSLVVGTGNGENYLTAVLPSSATAPNPYEIWVADDGKKLAFSADKTADGYTTYVLNELEGDVVSTKYGFLPTDKSDATAYPFVVFDEEKNFIGAYGSLKEAASPAKNVVVGPENADKIVYVLLRRNYTFGENGTSDYYANYSQIGGTFILDLDDHVFSLTTTYLFNATKKTTSNVLHDSSMAVINGEIKLNSGYLVYPDHSASATEVKNFNFLFENIIFSFDSSSCSANPLMAVATGKGVGLIVNVDFVDCTFKFDKVLDKNVTLFNLEKATDTISVNVRIKGGKIISNAEAMAKITIAKLGTNDSVNFVRSDDGEFTTLLYPVGDTAPSMAAQ